MGQPTRAAPAVWAHTDGPIASGAVNRTWLWGPASFTGALQEPYGEAPGGQRLVQHFRRELDGQDLPRLLPLSAVQRLADIIDQVQAAVPSLYAALPRQIIHGDVARGNVLMASGRVAGILDFEFAGPDLRAIDLATALARFVGDAWNSGREWPIIDVLVAGCASQCPLTPAEVAALPLLRLYRVASLLHWTGRQRQDLAAELIALDDWLADHEEALRNRLA